MTKLIKYVVYILAAYGGCSLLDEVGTRHLRAHKDEISKKVSDKVNEMMFGKGDPGAAWIPVGKDRYICSRCGNGWTSKYPYCPNCGTEMNNASRVFIPDPYVPGKKGE